MIKIEKDNILWAQINTSSHLDKIGYNIKEQTLYIDFLNGDSYKYYNVPSYKVLALLKSPSVGTYFWQEIRGVYQFEKV